jgi:hypothetical protein
MLLIFRSAIQHRGLLMATRTKALTVGVASVNFIIFLLAFTSIYPFPAGDFEIDLPSPNEILWDYDSGVVTVTAPFSIDNGGFYDVDDLELRYEVTNYTNVLIAQDVIELGTMKAGAISDGEIEFSFDLLELYNEGLTWMVFNDDLLNFVVEVSCFYTMKLVEFDARYSVSIPWDALIQDVAVEDDRFDPGSMQLMVDYRVTTSDILSSEAVLTASLLDGSSVVSETSETVQLGRVHTGTLEFDVPVGSSPDSVLLEIDIAGFPVDVSYSLPAGVIP